MLSIFDFAISIWRETASETVFYNVTRLPLILGLPTKEDAYLAHTSRKAVCS